MTCEGMFVVENASRVCLFNLCRFTNYWPQLAMQLTVNQEITLKHYNPELRDQEMAFEHT